MKNRLREIRESRGMSAADVGRGIGISGTQVQRIETGDREFKLGVLLSLCGFLDVTADEIIDIPVKGINKSKCDETLMDCAIGFVLEACERYGVKPDKRQISKWTTLVYNASVDLSLNVAQTRGMAITLVKASKKA
ncbi:MAG: helix-turn-helix transcriptional regulator [Alphaproteobacteria bacterium]